MADFPSASYDNWKTHNPDDDCPCLGPEPDVCGNCGGEHHNERLWAPAAGRHRCICPECAEGAREFDYDRENERED